MTTTESRLLSREPARGDYVALIRGLAVLGGHRVLFSYPRRHLSRSKRQGFAAEVMAFVDEASPKRKHPGTITRDYEVVAYRMERALVDVLVSRVNALFEWRAPLGEDLCVERADGTLMLISVAHEREAVLDLSSKEWQLLGDFWPALAAHTAPAERRRPGR